MKTLLLLLLPFLSCAQSDTLHYMLDSNFDVVDDSNQMVYKRKVFRTVNSTNWIVQDFYSSGQIQMTGAYKEASLVSKNGHFIWYDSLGRKGVESDFIANRLIGKDIYYYPNGNIDRIFEYDNKERLIKKNYFKEDGSGESEIIAAEYVGGKSALYGFILKNLKNPHESNRKIKGGKVFAQFEVGPNGIIQNIQILLSPDEALSNEAIRLLKLMPSWLPGSRDGKPFETTFTLPILFK